MTGQATALINRLQHAESPYEFRDWEDKQGHYLAACRISKEDVPALIEIARKWLSPDWSHEEIETPEDGDRQSLELLPVTAWRSLADLQSAESVQPLLDMLCELEVPLDDWTSEELPHVFGKIGPPALDALQQLVADVEKHPVYRSVAARGLQFAATYHEETRDSVVASLTELLTDATREQLRFNTTLLCCLVDLDAVEGAETIERAFANDFLDVGMQGDWEKVRRLLGVEGLGLEMPAHPYNSIDALRSRMGIGVFSQESIYGFVGEVDEEAEQKYLERAIKLFSKSEEAQQVIDRFGSIDWAESLLRFGLAYQGKVVDAMTLGTLHEYLFEYVPRKVSAEPERADSMVFELTKFWEYLDRVYQLPEAASIAEWLQSKGIVKQLRAELADPSNYGMAKSLVMGGSAAGYDTTSEEGMAAYLAMYNQSLQEPQTDAEPPASFSTKQRIGRNDPCPCGSGKKYKKCCRSVVEG